MIFYEF